MRTKQSQLLVAVIVIVIVVGAGGAIFISGTGKGGGSSTSTSSAVSTTSAMSSTGVANTSNSTSSGPFKVIVDNLTVGFQSGLWQVAIQESAGRQVKQLTMVLSTPTEAMICTGLSGSFSYAFCPATPASSGAFSAGSTFVGFATGAGPGSATPGKSYPVTIDVVYSDGSTLNDTLSAVALSSG